MSTQITKTIPPISKKQLIAILLLLGLGAGAGFSILRGSGPITQPEHGQKAHPQATSYGDKARTDEGSKPTKGPHGGKLFTRDGYGLELIIFETNTEPQFRVYTYQNGKPLTPISSQVSVTLERLGRKAQTFSFLTEQDFLKGNATVEEPHSFTVQIASQYDGKSYAFTYEQVESRVNLTDVQLKSSGIEISTVGPARIASELQLTGEVGFNQDRTVQVVPRLTGLVERVPVSVGDKVHRGQVLAILSSQMLAEQRSELMAAKKRLDLARLSFEREKKLWEDKISAKQDYQQAQQVMQEAEIAEQLAREKLSSLGAQAATPGQLTRYEIRSPIDGVITAKKISAGEVVKDDANIFTVADLSTVWVELNIYAKDLNTVKTGQTATVKAAAFDASATGTVAYVGALLGTQTKTAVARIVFPNPKGIWHPGLPVNVALVSAQADVPVAVLSEAVQTLRDVPVVFGRYGDSFEARPLQLGRSDGKMTEVLSGLEVGEKYAARNSYLIKADIGKSSASHDQ